MELKWVNWALVSPALLVALAVGCGSDPKEDVPSGNEQTKEEEEVKPADGPPSDTKNDTNVTETPAAQAGSGAPSDVPDPGKDKPTDEQKAGDPRGGCPGLDSGFPGDDACMAAPAADEGIQIHIGPSDYNDPAEVNKFVFKPGSESSQCYFFHLPNTEDRYYNPGDYVFSGRAGTHHVINTALTAEMADGGFAACAGARGEMLPSAPASYVPRRPVAPENKYVGRLLGAKSPAQADMHYYNFTDKDILRETWLNIYFAKDEVKEVGSQIRGMGGPGWQITPGTDKVYQYQTAPFSKDGRIVDLFGHYHAHGVRFSTYLKRAGTGTIEKVYEMRDFNDPAAFSYDSLTKNPAFSETAPGAVSGLLPVKAGDALLWECHIINDSMVTLTYSNEVNTGEMCNIWGTSLGPVIQGVGAAEMPFTAPK